MPPITQWTPLPFRRRGPCSQCHRRLCTISHAVRRHKVLSLQCQQWSEWSDHRLRRHHGECEWQCIGCECRRHRDLSEHAAAKVESAERTEPQQWPFHFRRRQRGIWTQCGCSGTLVQLVCATKPLSRQIQVRSPMPMDLSSFHPFPLITIYQLNAHCAPLQMNRDSNYLIISLIHCPF